MINDLDKKLVYTIRIIFVFSAYLLSTQGEPIMAYQFFTKFATSRPFVTTAGTGAFFLANKLYEVVEFQKKLDGLATPEKPVAEVHETEPEAWHIYGRQSEGLATRPKVEADAPSNPFKTKIDNETDYALFEEHPFSVITKGMTFLVQPHHMNRAPISSLSDQTFYEFAFARKRGFADLWSQSPLFHSSVALRKPNDKTAPGAILVTGEEIKTAVEKANDRICKSQTCNMYGSNCYSASTTVLVELIKEVDKRPGKKEDANATISELAKLLVIAGKDNFSQGVSNNKEVCKGITEVETILKKRDLQPSPEVEKSSSLKR